MIKRSARAVHRDMADEAGGLLLHLDSGAYYKLNSVGLTIWGLLEEERNLGDLVAEVRARHEDAPPELEEDVRGFLDELRGRDLITISQPEG